MVPINFEMGKFNMEFAITGRGEYKGASGDNKYDPMEGYLKINGKSDSFDFDFETNTLFTYSDMGYLKDWLDTYLAGKYEHTENFSPSPDFILRATPNLNSKGYYFGTMEIIPILTPENVITDNANMVTHIAFKDNGDVARFNNYIKDAIGEYSKDLVK